MQRPPKQRTKQTKNRAYEQRTDHHNCKTWPHLHRTVAGVLGAVLAPVTLVKWHTTGDGVPNADLQAVAQLSRELGVETQNLPGTLAAEPGWCTEPAWGTQGVSFVVVVAVVLDRVFVIAAVGLQSCCFLLSLLSLAPIRRCQTRLRTQLHKVATPAQAFLTSFSHIRAERPEQVTNY